MDIVRWLDKHKLFYWMPLLAVIAVILFFSIIPRPFEVIAGEKGSFFHELDFSDIEHIAAYFTLCFFMGVAFRHSKIDILRNNHYALAISLSLLIGAMLEFLQGFIPGRYLSFYDVMFNLTGIIPAHLLRYVLKKGKILGKIL
ncbi:hypothetical protein GF336_04035 [Candidatus Woesearchaeota archaeon]|nr:hypothetical protein [Candidatus Woesearchaeota archaeon]